VLRELTGRDRAGYGTGRLFGVAGESGPRKSASHQSWRRRRQSGPPQPRDDSVGVLEDPRRAHTGTEPADRRRPGREAASGWWVERGVARRRLEAQRFGAVRHEERRLRDRPCRPRTAAGGTL